jgi:hypothetical protein
MGWWDDVRSKLFGKSAPAEVQRKAEPPKWLSAEDPGNPFDVPILNLMGNLQVLSVTKDPAMAARALSWRAGQHDRLQWELRGEAHDCSLEPRLEYRVEEPLPDGMLFIPEAMEDKWVMAYRQGRIAAARSWSGETEVVAETETSAGRLRITKITFAESSALSGLGDPVAAFHWMMVTHALEQRVPFPASQEGADLLQAVPLSAVPLYGRRLFCAAVDYTVASPEVPLRSDGELVAAVGGGDVARVGELLDRGASLTAPSRQRGYRAIHLAVVAKQPAVLQLLLARGAGVDEPADHGLRALPLAIVAKCEPSMWQALVDAGAELESADAKGFRPLHAAAEADSAPAVRFLHERGANLEARTTNGVTPFHIACALGHEAAARELARLGADVKATSPLGTALEIARQEGKDAIAEWLQRP